MLVGLFLGVAPLVSACSSNSAPSSTGGSESRGSTDAPDGGFADAPAAAAQPTGDTFDGPGGSCKLTLHYGSTECSACVTDNCCAPVAACEADASCNALQACATDCLFTPDPGACFTACQQAHPTSDQIWKPLYTCWYHGACIDECTWQKQ